MTDSSRIDGMGPLLFLRHNAKSQAGHDDRLSPRVWERTDPMIGCGPPPDLTIPQL